MKTEVVVGATTPGTTQFEYPLVAAKLLGLKYKLISGYKGTTDIHLAMERGELQGMGSNAWLSLKALNADWIKEGKVIPIVHFNFERHPDLPNVPTIFDATKTESDRQAMALMVGRLEYGRPFFLPPGVAPERVTYMRRAFDATMKDQAFLEEAKKRNLSITHRTADEVQKLTDRIVDASPDFIAKVKKAVGAD